ncbi:MAG: AAA family ATPase [Crenarchaeota archaeon]|nr:AAA family ATPase [Thermoproteota archaeon]MDW8034312.1 AAA family ATPase [Nitrososphaerota archaeon]
MKHLILITGMPGSGKTTVAKIMGEKGFPVVSMGDAVREEAEIRGVGKNIIEMSRFMVELRKELGENAVAILVDKKIEKIESDIVIVDGVRSLKEVEYFKSKGYSITIVGVLSSTKLRYRRLSNRNRPDDSRILKELEERDMVEISVGVGGVIALSDVYVLNESSFEDLKEYTLKRLQEILSRKYR